MSDQTGDYMPISEAMVALGKSYATLRRYIYESEQGKLDVPFRHRKDRQRRVYILREDVENLQRIERELGASPPLRHTPDLNASLEDRIAELERSVDQLRDERDRLRQVEEEVHAQHTLLFQIKRQLDQASSPKKEQPSRSGETKRQTSDKPELPSTWDAWSTFVARHGLRPDQFDHRQYIQVGEFKRGRARVTKAMPPAKQEMFIRDRMLDEKFHECYEDGCVCHFILEQVASIEQESQ
jgi:hypothetical protein